MQIGEFAEICGTKISVLRHYDKEGLITPDYIDHFTGYRYYRAEQIGIFMKISALKKGGFSLKEIKSILSQADNVPIILDQISKKKDEITSLLSNLEEAKTIMLGVEKMSIPIVFKNQNGLQMKLTVENPIVDFKKSCALLEETAKSQDYQRISYFKTFGEPNSNEIDIVIDILRLQSEMRKLNDDINIPFENDDVVGKWEVVGEYAVKSDFYTAINTVDTIYGKAIKEIYFLPGGESYWCYGWTKNYLICHTGDGTSLNSYEVEDYNGEQYMFVQNKSYYYRRGGKPTVLVLRQINKVEYTKQDIAREDNIDLPFIDDKRILGKWKTVSYIRSKEDFDSEKSDEPDWLYFKNIEFLENGQCISLYGNETIAGDDMQTWTKGFVLRKWNSTACAYEIHEVVGVEYLIMEWKCGDYRWGGFDTDYYVFVRD
ncbi:MAG: MerR family transcriptional regulator [Eubacteriales bacterium]